VTAWSLEYDGYDPAEEGQREALCALGNGFFATRGAAPESRAGGVHSPGTYAAGCYNRLRDEIAGQVVENESMVNLPNWLMLTFAIDNGPWFELDQAEVLSFGQELDLRCGILTRRMRVRDSVGRCTELRQRRFVHMEQPHLAGLETRFTALNWSGRLRVRSGVDGAVENTGVKRYRNLSSRHLTTVAAEPRGDDLLLLIAETTQSYVRIGVAARNRIVGNEPAGAPAWSVVREPDSVAHELAINVAAGEQLTIEKIVALYTSRDRAVSEPTEAAVCELGQAGSFEELLERHVLAWTHLWRYFRVDLTDGDVIGEEALHTVHLHLFHLLQTVSPNSIDLDAGVPARGLHGEAYRGHVFWDELFVLPVLTLRAPALTRASLRYRYRRLPAARRAARDAGFAGAMYPWQSGSDGSEDSQRLHLNPLSGRWTPDVSHLQRHICHAVAYTAWQYYQSTGDIAFLVDHGAEMILEIARFWSSAANYDRGLDRFVIRGVMGPDEFHTGYPGADDAGIDNNAYTNIMAAWVLQRALDVLAVLPPRRQIELTETLGLRQEECSRWEEMTRRIFVPFHDGVISQFEGYADLAELDWEDYRRRFGEIQRLDRILESEGRSPNSFQVSKQADVLMLFYLLSADELRELLRRLGYRLTRDTIRKTIEYYLARTSHGSTLSALVHAWVLGRANRDNALEHYTRLLRSDTVDIQGGTTAEGVHLAAMAGSVDVLQRCFTGLETTGDTLRFNPAWPGQLGTLAFAMRYREHPLTVRINSASLRVSAEPGKAPPIRVQCWGQTTMLGPGDSAEFVMRPKVAEVR
jgi:trehalose/maltose hydrolase-like predicted phosphorylase